MRKCKKEKADLHCFKKINKKRNKNKIIDKKSQIAKRKHYHISSCMKSTKFNLISQIGFQN